MTSVSEPLVALGFTQLEADVYAWLLEESPATGYRIGQALRKPAPNIYKAIQSLESKGAVMVDEGRSRLCSPVPPDELLRALERRFQEDRRRAEESLAQRNRADGDDRVYRLRSRDAVFERVRAVVDRAREVVIVDAFPGPLLEIAPDLAAAVERGLRVAVLAYAPQRIRGADVVVDADAESTLQRWPCDWLNVVGDGSEHVIASFEPDGGAVVQAIWSESPYLAWVYHSGMTAELVLSAVEAALESASSLAAVRRRVRSLKKLRAVEAPGYHRLRRRYDVPETES